MNENFGHIIQIIPGGDWKVRYKEDDGQTTTAPVVAWALLDDGSVEPLDVDRNGLVDFARPISNFDGIEVMRP